MLMNLSILEEDILEVASFASDFGNQMPTASKALLDNCTSLLASKLHTPDDVAQFAREASKDTCRATLAFKLLAGMSNSAKSPHPDIAGSRGEVLKRANMEGGPGPAAIEPIQVSGKLLYLDTSFALFSFHCDGSQGEQICLFHPCKIIVNKQRLGAKNFKSLDAIAKVMSVGDPLGGIVVPKSWPKGASKPFEINNPGCDAREITPTWYAQAVWKGEKPTDISAALRPVGNQIKVEQEKEDWSHGNYSKTDKVKREECVEDGSSVENLKSKENEPVCPNCKVFKRKCLSGQEVRYIRPQSEQVLN